MIFAVLLGGDGAVEECGDAVDHIINILRTGGLIAGVHCQLCQTDIDGVEGNMAVGDIAQGAAAQHIGAVEEGLGRNTCLAADASEDRTGNAVGGSKR